MEQAKETLLIPGIQEGIKNSINDIQDLCHSLANESGWWKDIELPVQDNLVISQKLLLVITEVAEATEGLRKNLMDDKLPHRKMMEVELADALIRIFDLTGAMAMDIGGAVVEKLAFNTTRKDHKLEVRAQEGGKKF